jgi:hypothetical protein
VKLELITLREDLPVRLLTTRNEDPGDRGVIQ